MNTETKTSTGILSKDNAQALWRYATRPEIIPRIRELGLHFGHFAYLIALVLHSARLMPQGHPALNAAHIGQFGVRQVLAIAASHITWSWRNIDQIAIFGAVVSGIIMIAIQAVLIAIYAVMGTAQASSSTSFFTTPQENVATDVVLKMMDQVFGPSLEIFGTASDPVGTPVYLGLHAVLSFYSMAMMVIAVIIVVYYIMTVVGEAAKTGTPFGKRFDSLWAPIRLVAALGLLVPLGSGLNSAQYLTLWMAKMGSGLGTMVWSTFIDEFTEPSNITTRPPEATTVDLVNRIFLSEVCAASYNQINEGNAEQVQILQKYGNRSGPADFSQAANMIALAQMFEDDAVIITWDRHAAGGDIDEHTCGYVRVNLTEFDEAVDASDSGFAGGNIRSALLEIHQGVKAQYVRQIGAIAEAVRPSAQAIARNRIEINKKPEFGQDAPLATIPDDIREITNDAARALSTTLELSYDQMTGATFGNKETMVQQGWGAAGMWFSNIAKINQQYMEAISAGVPVFGNVADVADGESRERSGFMRWFGVGNMGLDSGTAEKIEETIRFASDTYGEHIQQDSLYGNTKFTLPDDDLYADGSQLVADAVVGIFGGGPLRDLQQNPTLDPMAKLTQGGHHMITGSFIMFGVGALAGTLSLLPGVFSKIPMIGGFFEEASGVLKGAMSILFAIGVIGLLAGCMLAYVLPLIPFIYFTFAVLGWVLEIFEAIAAMPLWALAHLRIDGDGIAGPAALGGYQLLLMILIRPALIVIGLIGGSVIFGASMFYLSSLFDSAVSISRDELTGGTTGPVGLIVYTVIFVFLAYNIALMCFKLIDDVPKGMLRWLGAGISPFSDSRADPIGGQQALMIGALGAGSQLIGGGRSGLQSSQKGFERGRMRRQGMDPDNPIQSVRIAGDAAGSPGGGGAPGGGPLAGMGAKGQEFVNRNPKGPSSSLADRPSDTDPRDGD
ncbi:DotA/TraY family protein [Thalassobius sp. I31.1]|uniref:DotA/TraY family protein n=1 Tax=Thalassobius sp. I31.1 TaxID=2109912 RepID=UPI000D1AE6D8|nr:DotA/TraY family protein [Thalassobius sp. I31.1]